jgi:hypothetical protein
LSKKMASEDALVQGEKVRRREGARGYLVTPESAMYAAMVSGSDEEIRQPGGVIS